MGLEFYNVETKGHLFTIKDDEVSNFEIFFDAFNEKYNNLIDLYGDFRLYSNHLIFLKELFSNVDSGEIIDFRNLVEMCIQANITVAVNGN